MQHASFLRAEKVRFLLTRTVWHVAMAMHDKLTFLGEEVRGGGLQYRAKSRLPYEALHT